MARDLLRAWLDRLKIDHVVAVAPPFNDGIPLVDIDPTTISHAFFICGPFGDKELETHFLRRFANARLVGLNLSMDLPVGEWNPFDFLIERDSTTDVHSDMIFGFRQPLPPVVGVCLVEDHPEADVAVANAAIERLLKRHPVARLPIDTRLDFNEHGLRTPGEVEAMFTRLDWLVTTRLHGLVLALKNGVPVIAIDAVPGGGKISRQCRHIGWPCYQDLGLLSDERLDEAVAYVSGAAARSQAAQCAAKAALEVTRMQHRVETALQSGALEESYAKRQAIARSALPDPPADSVGERRTSLARKLWAMLGL
jgi:hypothetical protein